MTVLSRSTLALLALLAGAIALPVQAAAPKPPTPAAVLGAFKQAYPKATIKRTIHEERDGKAVVEIESVDHGLRRDLLYAVDGHLLECEETIPADSLPVTVREALNREAPGAKVGRIERIDREGVVSYSINVKAKGKAREILLDPTGNTLEP